MSGRACTAPARRFSTATKSKIFRLRFWAFWKTPGPKESLILGRLSGGPLEHTGVMQGMSGSPVYIDGKLIGAVAMAFPYAKDPIAGIRPIEEMLSVDLGRAAHCNAPRSGKNADVASLFPTREAAGFGDTRMTEVATPLSLSGFTAAAVEQFAPQMRKLGLEPRQGISTGGAPEDRMGDPSRLQPGSMISVELMTGDMSVGADGTVTAIDGNKVYAFGHRFLAVGPTDLPFTRSEVMALLANVNTSFKISSGRELMGVISQDRNTAIDGSLGNARRSGPARYLGHAGYEACRELSHADGQRPLSVALPAADGASSRRSTPPSAPPAFPASWCTERSSSKIARTRSGCRISTRAMAVPRCRPRPQTAVPLAYLMQAGFDQLKVKRVSLQLESFDVKKELNIGQVYLSRKEAKPGDTVELMTQLDGENGVAVTRIAEVHNPARHRARHSLLHRRGRHADRPRRAETDHC